MNRYLKEQFDKLKNSNQMNPDESWISENRIFLLNKIKADRFGFYAPKETFVFKFGSRAASAAAIFIPKRLSFAFRPVMTMLLIFAVAASGWIATVGASYNSVPGDSLYNVKLATEKFQGAVAGIGESDQQNIKRNIDRAQRRSEEIRVAAKNVQKNPSTKPKVEESIKEVAIKDLGQSLHNVEAKLQNVGDDGIVEVAKVLNEGAGKIKEALNEVAKSMEEDNGLENQNEGGAGEFAVIMKEVSKTADSVGFSAVENAVNKKGEDDAVKKIVKDVIDTKIGELKESAGALNEIDGQMKFDLIEKIATSTETLVINVKDIFTSSTMGREGSVEKVVEGVEKEAGQLIEANKLNEVMQVVKEVNQITARTGEVIVDAKKNIVAAEEVANSESADANSVMQTTTSTTTGTQPVGVSRKE